MHDRKQVASTRQEEEPEEKGPVSPRTLRSWRHVIDCTAITSYGWTEAPGELAGCLLYLLLWQYFTHKMLSSTLILKIDTLI